MPPDWRHRFHSLDLVCNQHLMLDDIYEHVVINDPFLLLEAIHPALLTDVVDHAVRGS